MKPPPPQDTGPAVGPLVLRKEQHDNPSTPETIKPSVLPSGVRPSQHRHRVADAREKCGDNSWRRSAAASRPAA
jgi:hypothetical protein